MTGSELQPHRPADVVHVDVDLDVWASQMANAGSIGKALAPTAFIPRSLRVFSRPEGSNRDELDVPGTTAAVAAAVLTGKEIGLSPMAALRSIDVIEGTPAIRAVALRALVLQAGHEIWVEESTATRAIVCGQRRGSSREQRSTWTLDRAKTAGLAGKPNWRSHPGAMLIARATAEVCRLIAPDVMLGLPYTVEEISDGDITEDEPRESGPDRPATPRRTAQRRTRKATTPARPAIAPAATEAVEDEPPLDDEQSPAAETKPIANDTHTEPEPPAEAMATTAQLKAVDRALGKVQITTKHRKIQAVRQIIGRPIEGAEQLYAAEAVVVLDELARLAERMREQQDTADGDGDGDRWDEVMAGLDDEQADP